MIRAFVPGSMRLPDPEAVLEKAWVPEHSIRFMRAMACGEPFLIRDHLFVVGEDWLVAVGYPLDGAYEPAAFEDALADAVKQTRPAYCWAAAPCLPQALAGRRVDKDCYYVLDTAAQPPSRLLSLAGRAEATLRVDQGRTFTPAHRRLWDEFTKTRDLPERVRAMFDRTGRVLAAESDLFLLNAWDARDNLAACLLIDYAPERFACYIIGAHSRKHYTPYASDLLFREMIDAARKQNKDYIHLGLGVNRGIRRFKTKWGGEPRIAYEMAAWEEKGVHSAAGLSGPPGMPVIRDGQDKWKFIQSLPPQRKLAMLWQVEKNGRRSWIAGASHFCRFSFRAHLRKVFSEVDAVLCEGPLDRVSMEVIAGVGRNPEPDSLRLAHRLEDEAIDRLERVVCGSRGCWARLFNTVYPDAPDVRGYLSGTRHWFAFYGLWSAFLRRHGWDQSVDLEAWHLARDMGKYVLGMETIAEQLATLEHISADRIVRFFRSCGQWDRMRKQNERGYLRGDLETMFGTSTEFPTRTELVIGRRDERFLNRMRPFMEEGGCAVFVGTAHMLNLPRMLEEAGFTVRGPGR